MEELVVLEPFFVQFAEGEGVDGHFGGDKILEDHVKELDLAINFDFFLPICNTHSSRMSTQHNR